MTNADFDSVSPLRRRKSDMRRLESWKAIANYLNRSVRTVRRWEATESLPVHRLQHQKGYSVFAYEAEIDAWRSQQQFAVAGDDQTVSNDTQPAPRSARLAVLLCAAVVAVAFGGIGGYWLSQQVSTDADFLAQEAGYWPASVAQVVVSPAFSAWSDGRVHDAHAESQRIERQLPNLPEDIRVPATDYLVELAVTLGRLEDARQLAQTVSDKQIREAMEARIAFAGGDMSMVKQVLDAGTGYQSSAAQRAIVMEGMQALMQGDSERAEQLLLPAAFTFTIEDQGYYFVALDLLARSYAMQDNLPQAITTLEKTMGELDAAAHRRSGLFWMMCQRRLASMYRDAGREFDANNLEERLRDMLVLADSGFPLAESLRI